jgi:hypothetical protein
MTKTALAEFVADLKGAIVEEARNGGPGRLTRLKALKATLDKAKADLATLEAL